MARDEVYSHYPETLVIGAGETAEIPAIAGQNAITMKWASGGSMLIVGVSLTGGSTFAVANEYLLGTNEVYNSNMSGTMYIMATGSTLTCYVNRYRSAGT